MDGDAGAPRRARGLLALGALAGIALAGAGLVRGGGAGGSLAPGEVARVNGVPLPAETLERLLAGLAADKRTPLSDADRARVLERLIEEELLLQRAQELGLAESDPGIRKALVTAVVDSVVAEAESEEPDEAELRRFFEERRAYFGAGSRLRVERLEFRAGAAAAAGPRERALAALAALEAGEAAAAVGARLADEPLLPLPDVALPPASLREYVGPEVVDALLAAPEGRWAGPFEGDGGAVLARVVERRAAEAPAFEPLAAQVAAEWRRRAADRALRAYLDALRREADVVLAPDAPR
jgi:hypothetical protein